MLIYEVPLDGVLWVQLGLLSWFFFSEAINLHRYVTLILHLVHLFCFKAHVVKIWLCSVSIFTSNTKIQDHKLLLYIEFTVKCWFSE